VFIRLDAIAYLWKEIGTPCIHLPQTHQIVQLMRAVLDAVAPEVMLITETNVPHADNISYFGDGTDEAQLVYNFALPPLVLHTLQTGSARALSVWAESLTPLAGQVTFLNFLASHDGIGLNPVRGILSAGEIGSLAERGITHGGLISEKQNQDGSRSPYELNINYFDALANPLGNEPLETQVDRFLAAQAIMLSLAGVPGIYFHSLFGSRGWPEGVRQTGHPRTINRQKLVLADLERELDQPGSLRQQVFHGYTRLLKARTTSPAFHPFGDQRIQDYGEAIFAVMRISPRGGDHALCLQNVTHQPQTFALRFPDAFEDSPTSLFDLISGERLNPGESALTLMPYQSLWLSSSLRH
jgi:sucrose phosphorylase